MNSLKWNPLSCKDQKYETKYFKDLIKFLDKTVNNENKKLWNREWTEKDNTHFKKSFIQKECKHMTCKTDRYVCPKTSQFVLGRFSMMKCYLHCNRYKALNISDHNIFKNDVFIFYILKKQKKQIIDDKLPVCKYFPIRIILGKDQISDHEIDKMIEKNQFYGSKDFKKRTDNKILLKNNSNLNVPCNISARELCILYHAKLNFYLTKTKNKYNPFILVSPYSLSTLNNHYKTPKDEKQFYQIFTK